MNHSTRAAILGSIINRAANWLRTSRIVAIAFGCWAAPAYLPTPTRLHAAENEIASEQSSRRWSALPVSASPPKQFLTALGAREIGCAAAVKWEPALALQRRGQTIARLYCEEKAAKRQAAAALQCFLQMQAAHQEDIGAASAMRAYYGRIAIGQQQALIANGVQLVEAQQSKQDRLMEQGLAAGTDLSSLHRQLIDLQDSGLQAASQDQQLRSTLYALTDIDYDCAQCLLEPLLVQTHELDCECLVSIALRNRCDVRAWRYLCSQVNEDSAPLFVSMLVTSFTGFGIPVPVVAGLKQILCNHSNDAALAESLRSELAMVIQTNENWIQETMLTKCSELRLAYQRLELEQQRLASWQRRLEQIGRLESLGQAKPDQRAAAEAGSLQSQADEVKRRLDAKLAEVSLAETVGGLAQRCCHGEAWLVTGR